MRGAARLTVSAVCLVGLSIACKANLYPAALSPEVGPDVTGTLETNGRVSVGGTTRLGVHWTNPGPPGAGLILGLENEQAVLVGKHRPRPFDRHRFGLFTGFGWEPLPYRPPVGAELTLGGGWGRFPTRRETRPAGYGAARFLLPIRLTRRRQPWDAEEMIGAAPVIAPWVGSTFFAPTDVSPRFTAEGGVALRLTIWTPLSP